MMMRYIGKFLILIVLLFTASNIVAQENSLSGGLIVNGAVIELEDLPLSSLSAHTVSARAVVSLGLGEDLNYYGSLWSLTINYSYNSSMISGSQSGSLTINYDPVGNYIDKSVKTYDLPYTEDMLSSLWSEDDITIDSYVLTGLSDIPESVYISLSYDIDRFYELDNTITTEITCENSGSFGFSNTENPLTLDLSWGVIEGAESYDLEWLFVENIDCPEGLDCLDLIDMEIDFSNATRISTEELYYTIPLAYSRGYILYRVRSVGSNFLGSRSEGRWNWAPESSVSSLLGSSFLIAWKGLEEGKNWQYNASYQEEGKRKELISYYDGNLYNRQSITLMNEDDYAIIGQTYYDYQGRPAIEVMPSPRVNNGLTYYSNENKSTGNIYNRQNFDQDDKIYKEYDDVANIYNYYGPDPMDDTGEGASAYYSLNGNSVSGTHQAFIPSTDGYPFSRTVYSNDGLNRVLQQSNMGYEYRSNSGRAIETIYTMINEGADLDRLFGNEVGYNGYRKDYTIDNNGQISVAYYDQSNRLIASGIMSNTTADANLVEIDTKGNADTVETPLNVGEEFEGDIRKGISTIFSSHPIFPTVFDFHYEIEALEFEELCESTVVLNVPCVYNLEIKVFDEDGNLYPFTIDGVELYTYTQSAISAAFSKDFSISFPPGEYTVVKTLSIDESVIAGYQTSYTAAAIAEEDCAELVVELLEYPEEECGCEYLCGIVFTYGPNELGEMVPVDPSTMVPLTAIEYATQLNTCLESCDLGGITTDPYTDPTGVGDGFGGVESYCDERKEDLLRDMSLGGQYFDNTPFADNADYNAEAWLDAMEAKITVYNAANPLYPEKGLLENLNIRSGGSFPDWKTVKCVMEFYTSYDPAEDDEPTCIDVLSLPLSSDGLSITTYSWDDIWLEEAILPYHPEYFVYAFRCDEMKLRLEEVPLYSSAHLEEYRAYAAELLYTAESTIIGKNLFDPLNIVNNVSTGASYAPTNSTYPIPSGLTSFIYPDDPDETVETGYIDDSGNDPMPYSFDESNPVYNEITVVNPDETITVTPSDLPQHFLNLNASGGLDNEYPLGPVYKKMYDYLNRHLINEDEDGFYTIWDILNYDNETGPLYDDYPVYNALGVPEFYSNFIGGLYAPGTGMLSEDNPEGMSKYNYFYSRYAFYREYLLYQRTKTASVQFRSLYPIYYSTIYDYAALFTDRFKLGAMPISAGSFLTNEDIAYSYVDGSSTTIDVCYKCDGQDEEFQLHYPQNDTYETYSVFVDYIEEYYTAVEEGSTTLPPLGSDVLDLFDSDNPALTTDDPECGADCMLEVAAWMSAVEGCMNSSTEVGLSEETLNDIKDQLLSICVSRCDDVTAVSPGSWIFVDGASGLTIVIQISPGTPEFVKIYSAPLPGEESCSFTFQYLPYESDVVSCACSNLDEFIVEQGDDLDTESTTFDTDLTSYLIGAGIIDGTADYNAGWYTYCQSTLATPDVRTFAGLNGSGAEMPDDMLECGFISGQTALNQDLILCYQNWFAQTLSIDAYNESLVTQFNASFQEDYETYCKDNVAETFTASSLLDEYQYTLYFYDQANNLIKTVPPSGTEVLLQEDLTSTPDISDVQLHRENPFHPFIHPEHDMISNYKYNSLNEVLEQTTPDGGIIKIWYDRLGRIAVSKNAEQIDRYSYTVYDSLGRIIEVGEKKAPGGTLLFDPELMYDADIFGEILKILDTTEANEDLILIDLADGALTIDDLDLADYPDITLTSEEQDDINTLLSYVTFDEWMAADHPDIEGDRYEVTRTFYDDFCNDYVRGAFGGISFENYFSKLDLQHNLKSRVSSILYSEHIETSDADVNDYETGLHYSYDLHGNVKTMLQELRPNQLYRQMKRVDYDYDLVNGNVKQISYQRGENDQFYQRYYYDADNRVTTVETSNNGIYWEQDAHYEYYVHGPLARTELGSKQVQGLDYAYTAQGWLKAINGTNIDAASDIGQDAYVAPESTTRYTAKDAIGFSLGYYVGDYKSQQMAFLSDFDLSNLGDQEKHRSLYNGNIAHMVNTISGAGIQATQYKYDQLNRIKEMRVFEPIASSDNFSAQVATNKYQSNYSYDGNGNITHLQRADQNGFVFDDMTYQYGLVVDNQQTNRLRHVSDAVASDSSLDVDLDDIDTQPTNNYHYDDLGQLTRDQSEEIEEIVWNLNGKIKEIKYASSSDRGNMEFFYDGMGNRVLKVVKPKISGVIQGESDWILTHYVHDASSKLLARYDEVYSEASTAGEYVLTSSLDAWNIYGSSRLGVAKHNNAVTELSFFADEVSNELVSGQFTSSSIDISNGYSVYSKSDMDLSLESSGEIIFRSDSPIMFGSLPSGITLASLSTIEAHNEGYYEYVLNKTTSGSQVINLESVSGFDMRSETTMLVSVSNVLNLSLSYNSLLKNYNFNRNAGLKYYELSNHLGNVLATVSDRKIAVEASGTGLVDYYTADVLSYTDYYPFGMEMPGRKLNSSDYKFGFNGMEKDDEVKGGGNSYDFGARIYDNRLGRWLSLDPLQAKYPSYSPYNFVANSPLQYIDPDGERIISGEQTEMEAFVKDLNFIYKEQYGIENAFSVVKKEEVVKEQTNEALISDPSTWGNVFEEDEYEEVTTVSFEIEKNEGFDWDSDKYTKAMAELIDADAEVYVDIVPDEGDEVKENTPLYRDGLLKDYGGGYTPFSTYVILSDKLPQSEGANKKDDWTLGTVGMHELLFHISPTGLQEQSPNDMRTYYGYRGGNDHGAGNNQMDVTNQNNETNNSNESNSDDGVE